MSNKLNQLDIFPDYIDYLFFNKLDSTNKEICRMIHNGSAESGSCVVSETQTLGRGRNSNTWSSDIGGLYLSLLLESDIVDIRLTQLSFVISLAVRNFVSDYIKNVCGNSSKKPKFVSIKWPNDIFIKDKKVGGILLEVMKTNSKDSSPNIANTDIANANITNMDVANANVANTDDIEKKNIGEYSNNDNKKWIIIGVGVNFLSKPDEIEKATSIAEYLNKEITDFDALILAGKLIKHIRNWYNFWSDKGFLEIREKWLQHVLFLGEKIEVNYEEYSVLGVFSDINKQGELILDIGTGQKLYVRTGDIFSLY